MTIAKTVCALAAGAVGGALFFRLGTPLPWLLGAFAATLIVTVTAGWIDLDGRVRRIALPIMGVLIGASFHPEILEQISRWPAGLITVAVYALLCTGLGFVYFRRIVGWDPATSLCASPPGGLVELVFVGADLGADERRLILAHTMRIAIVVVVATLTIRFYFGVDGSTLSAQSAGPAAIELTDWLVLGACAVIGGYFGVRLNLPGGAIFGALLLSAAVHLAGLSEVSPPAWIIAVTQVVLGTALGVRFRGITRREASEIVSHAAVWGISVLVLAFLVALALAGPFGLDPRGLFLALSPGGFSEMLLVALAIGIEPAFVATSHSVRLIIIFLGVPAMGRLLQKRTKLEP